ncbi:3-hydroxyacyl-CoA dehydrogenase type-2 [Rhizophagus irregularis]|uniref:3-hydroxyacyl-CoA dehydrogenase type-2 n=4 Tax=Rhizophagus irregularis TaxID=588596 RepID=A0A2I1H618_9GLOM|nr:3-hydroxyacyl-CoA dehydrogenase type-2 [Rhizophagus irregularis DAOM 181602=DAOM 197198]EXX64248.1 Sps19p [Rhizophagus irregularis DAOM 197198w]PKC17093.1 3-hydroxyacyl-CoA dehydrogenase type-2 [Rhizophagus irregularis]PKC64137.1 3-hydroxyacyl-CoA dehydrogenase type-2 [Rhizophagus irregularis]PKK61114.1 3-hydroxyacyl-CoA dehydrogenase type-2 [Rhizophagus irregularis]PKY15852.1 3-hydroxyacyl-CoA dehydrogenase type-2 [Rhizophagus irregularis]|eukprot:XP_025186764.1 3-hydroxyacyl-CoA dehydrogenase type-2 [Rhizophagus irregularis DAOM 181602=DAOM 197198]
MQIKGNTFIVTGGGSGLGLSAAQELLRLGANVVVIDLKNDGKSFFKGQEKNVLFVQADVTSEEEISKAIQQAVEKFGENIRGVVNCGGVFIVGKIIGSNGKPLDLNTFKFGINVNLVGTFNVCRLVAAQMVKQKPLEEGERGVIVNISSIAYQDGQVGQVTYSATKGGVASMTLPMTRDLSRFGIRVVAIAPGLFETPMASTNNSNDRVYQKLLNQIEFPGRFGKADGEFNKLVIHLIENTYMNGEIIRIDAGTKLGKL